MYVYQTADNGTLTAQDTSTCGGNCYVNNAPSDDIDDIEPSPKQMRKQQRPYKKVDLRYSHSKQIRTFYKMRGNR